ncbi:MAG TPA: tail fiber domain-containing protein [Longimicrobium sp.]|jgi:hypothetical protein|uniref:tail fiber domain-containing protein n=1 Tax=Longimicrobium sp. TaxID=2029185 RepID=UPI002EDB6AE7
MRTRLFGLATAALLALSAAPAAAQSDILLQLRSGSPLGDRFRVDSAGGVVAKGDLGIGIIPATGEGERMMWYPFKAAFRVGSPGYSGTTAWDDANIGFYSVAAGYSTIATGIYSVALGGENVAASQATTVSGRLSHAGTSFRGAANNNGGAVALGTRVTADADYGFAAGYRASTAGRVGAYVWGGTLAGASAASDSLLATADGQWSARAPGGYRLFTNQALTTGVTIAAGGSSWNVVSDRSRKEGFADLDGEDVLTRLRRVPVTEWRYRDEADRTVRHIGPMAQDWHAAFGLNGDDRTINMSDFDGVNLAAVKALDARSTAQAARVEELAAENAALRADVEGLRSRNAELAERLRAIEAALAARP